MNASEIVPGLWQGDQLSGVRAAQYDFDVVVDLTPPTGSAPVLKDGAVYISCTLVDGPLPEDMDHVARLSETCVEALREGKRVLVHCAAGLNRSGLVSALVVRAMTGCTGREALAHVRERRTGALINPWFVTYLEGLP